MDEKGLRERRKKGEIQALVATVGGKKRQRLDGGGRKPLSVELEELLLEWIYNRRACDLHVSCKMIMKKAEVTYLGMKSKQSAEDEGSGEHDDFKD